jgi:hypothetical protein
MKNDVILINRISLLVMIASFGFVLFGLSDRPNYQYTSQVEKQIPKNYAWVRPKDKKEP